MEAEPIVINGVAMIERELEACDSAQQVEAAIVRKREICAFVRWQAEICWKLRPVSQGVR